MTDNELLLSISNIMDTKLNCFENRMDKRFDALDKKIDKVEQNLNQRIDEVEENLNTVEERLNTKIHKTNLLIENQVLPRIKEIESCYLSTFERYQQEGTKIEQLQLDVTIIKDVLIEHGEKIKMYQTCVS